MRYILIKSGTIISASDIYEGDILIEGEKIAEIGHNLPAANDAEIIDARGKLVLPRASIISASLAAGRL